MATKERKFELYWEGPYTRKQIVKYAKKNKDAAQAWSLYALYDDHPLYGRQVLSYFGKAIEQPLVKRIHQHNWWSDNDIVYVASIYDFESWEKSSDWDYSEAIRTPEVISKIEELLIMGLGPAYNMRNKNSAKNSWDVRIFNTGNLGPIPQEVSGRYTLERSPFVEESD